MTLAAFFAASAVLGCVFLAAAMLIRWTEADAGWRAALFSAGFAMIILGALAPTSGAPFGRIMLVVAAAAQFFVAVSALQRRRRAPR